MSVIERNLEKAARALGVWERGEDKWDAATEYDREQLREAAGVVLDAVNHRGAVEEIQRLRNGMARALERTQVDDPGEATMILEQYVNLDGTPAGGQ